jgi:mannose/fructose/N-acetylgalactosamine-specific phosphotransferase system component IIC
VNSILSSPLSILALVGSILTIVSFGAILKNAIQKRKRKVFVWGFVLAISLVVGVFAAANAPGGDDSEALSIFNKMGRSLDSQKT